MLVSVLFGASIFSPVLEVIFTNVLITILI